MDTLRRVCLLAALVAAVTFAPVHAAGISVDGIVLAPGGRPAVGARIELHPVPSLYEAGLRELKGESGRQPVARVRTDGAGHFRLTAPQAGLWRVIVIARGFVSLKLDVPVVEPIALPSAELQPDVGLTVRIEDASGRPVQGAQVIAEGFQDSWPPREWEPIRQEGRSGPDGRLRFPSGPDASLRLWALAKGHPPGQGAAAARERSATVRLPLGTSRRVQVSNSEGRPVPGALLWHLPSRLLLGRTGGAGRMLLSVPAQGGFEILATDGQSRTITHTNRKIVLPPKTLLTGQVVDLATLQPVRGAFVWPEMDPGAFVRTDEKGFYRMPWDPGRDQPWIAAASGYLTSREPIPSAGSSRALPDFVLHPDLPLQGQVVDEQGEPVAGAEVQLYLDELGANPWDFRWSRTDAAGRFRVPGLCRECVFHLRASRSGFAPLTRILGVPPTGPNPDVRLVLSQGRTATGLVLDGQGRPVVGAAVELLPLSVEQDLWVESTDAVNTLGGTTGTDGRFAVPNVPMASYTARIEAKGFAVLVEKVAVSDDRHETDLGRFELARTGTVSGYVYDSQGRPAAGAQVWVQLEDDPGLEVRWQGYLASGPAALTASDGSYTVQAPARGALYFCWQGSSDFLSLEQPDSDPARIVMRDLVPTTRITGRVLDSSRRPIPGVEVTAGSLGGCGGVMVTFDSNPCPGDQRLRESDVSDEAGRFTLIVPVYDPKIGVWARAAGFMNGEWEIEIQPEQAIEDLPLVLATGSVLTGRVLGPDGAPAAGTELFYLESVHEIRTDVEGRFRLTGLRPGLLDLLFLHPQHGDASRSVEVAPGESYIEVTFEKTVQRLKGRVIDSNGDPVFGAQVIWGDRDAKIFIGFTAGDGSFQMGLHEGRQPEPWLYFEVHPPGQAPSFWRQGLQDSLENGIEIRLP